MLIQYQFLDVSILSNTRKGLILLTFSHTIPTFKDPEKKSLLKTLWEKPLENIVEKGENAGNQDFLFFP